MDKIEQLRKSLAAMKPKDHNTIVPALSLPPVKSLSISSASPGKPAKLPGVSQPSGKDPTKMAEQLKNPRPKKVKVEVLKTASNGQWTLEKEDSEQYKRAKAYRKPRLTPETKHVSDPDHQHWIVHSLHDVPKRGTATLMHHSGNIMATFRHGEMNPSKATASSKEKTAPMAEDKIA
jgi:hypothetical protein